ncbi:hypothetical protein, partial [Klebsiella pneumoniae]|uniref:hypothetical protein n=1 Tax=Klebsiella pneumoniae TaxID=573 RepID=UPI0025A2AC44
TDGNVVVVRDSRNTYTYYTVGDKPVKTYLMQANGDPLPKAYGFVDATYTTETAMYGRGADDASYKMVVNSTASSSNGYFNYPYT